MNITRLTEDLIVATVLAVPAHPGADPDFTNELYAYGRSDVDAHTSDGRRLADIRSEMDARRIVHTLGITQLRGPYSWDVVDNQGRLFVAEIRRRSGGGR